MRAVLVFLSFGFLLAACAPAPPANILVWSADFVSPTDWYQTNITSGRVYYDYSTPGISRTLWAGANGVNKIQECSVYNSTFGYYGPEGDCSKMVCVKGHSGGLCWCDAPCNANAFLCALETFTYSGPCKIRGVTGDSWKVAGAENFICMSQGKPLGITSWDNYDVVVEFSNFKTSVPESTWELPAYCSKPQGATILGEKK